MRAAYQTAMHCGADVLTLASFAQCTDGICTNTVLDCILALVLENF